MDDRTANYAEISFHQIKNKLTEFLKIVGFRSENVIFVPISAWFGENLTEKSEKLPWYDGPTLLEAFQKFEPPKRQIEKPLRLPVQNVFHVGGVGTITVGRVETGILKTEMAIVYAPNAVLTSARTIGNCGEMVDKGFPGDIVSINTRGISKKDVWRGNVIGDRHNDPPRQV
jgi:elongation factor 1-alpha